MTKVKNIELDSLAKEILRHKALYYEGNPEVSDHQYDKLEDQLRKLDPNHKVLKTVGSELSEDTSRHKQTHKIPMLSLAKTYVFEELIAWKKDKDILATAKIDGNSLSLIYQAGKLKLAKTRGNGVEGEDVTHKIMWVDSIPKRLTSESLKALGNPDDNLEIEIRGELYCNDSKFLELSQKMLSLGLPQATSTRNIVAGVLSRKQHIHLARYFNFFAFNVLFEGSNQIFETEVNKVKWLKKANFIPPETSLFSKENDIKDYLTNLKENKENLEFPSDGAVFSFNDLSYHETLGETAHHPRYKLSFKWQGETAVTKIQKINWSPSRFGTITPVAHIDPVNLSDAVITNVTLHNLAHVKLFKLKKGDHIEIVRSGEVIPKFLQVVKQTDGEVEIPQICPSCESDLEEEDIRLVCSNIDCEARRLHRILNWIKHSGIEDLSEKRLLPLMETKKVTRISDLYKLTKENFLELPFTKEKLASKLFKSIENSKTLSLLDFLCALGIEGSGKTTWANLILIFPSLEKLIEATEEEIAQIDGFAEKSAQQIKRGLQSNESLIQNLKELGIIIKKPKKQSGPMPLSGLSFVLTGTLTRPREEVIQTLSSLGAKVTSSVTGKTHALVSQNFDKKTSKTEKAKKLSVPLWSEDDLMNFIDSKNS